MFLHPVLSIFIPVFLSASLPYRLLFLSFCTPGVPLSTLLFLTPLWPHLFPPSATLHSCLDPLFSLTLLSFSLYLSNLLHSSHVPVTLPEALLSKLFQKAGLDCSDWNNGKFNKSQRESDMGWTPHFLSIDLSALICSPNRDGKERKQRKKGMRILCLHVHVPKRVCVCAGMCWRYKQEQRRRLIKWNSMNNRNLLEFNSFRSRFLFLQISSELKQQGFVGSKEPQKYSHHFPCGYICVCGYECCWTASCDG